MRMSCNGCRVLRKGCGDDCSIRPCLQWIKSPESQANATIFLSKFYGRAGLINLINSGAEDLRPAIFRSLLYESCGRLVNPMYGSVGLLWSGSWHLCQAAVEAVLKGAPIIRVSSEAGGPKLAGSSHEAVTSSYDIRHVSKEATASHLFGQDAAAGPADVCLRKVNPATRTHFKRPGGNSNKHANGGASSFLDFAEVAHADDPLSSSFFKSLQCSPVSVQSGLSHESSPSRASGETGETSMVTNHDADLLKDNSRAVDDCKLELELTLGMKPVSSRHTRRPLHGSCPTSSRRH
ncbi:unnamed protein product [Spirodela intermedia]|uniref:LOB domain-containing protein n=1 Tax=Spirodela intermedia TaxID=51605 RepID=A0A7I8KYP7_SPIIN|nr:unnamed protein product [Spirodela intermedia]